MLVFVTTTQVCDVRTDFLVLFRSISDLMGLNTGIYLPSSIHKSSGYNIVLKR
jgi:hypothetical protein